MAQSKVSWQLGNCSRVSSCLVVHQSNAITSLVPQGVSDDSAPRSLLGDTAAFVISGLMTGFTSEFAPPPPVDDPALLGVSELCAPRMVGRPRLVR